MLDKPPNKTELANLAEFLGAQSLAHAHGVMTAVASAPGMVMPSQWLSAVTGDSEFESMAQAQKISSTIMSLYNHTLTELNAGGLTLMGNDLAAWCHGYMAGVELDKEWLDHTVALQAIDPIRKVTDGSAKSVSEKIVTETAISTHLMLNAWRREQIAAGRIPGVPAPSVPARRDGPKVGRNDPCPCGSGKKFKKCHGLEN